MATDGRHGSITPETLQQLASQASYETDKTLANMLEWAKTFNPQVMFGPGGPHNVPGGPQVYDTVHNKYLDICKKMLERSWQLIDARAEVDLYLWSQLGATLPPTPPHDASIFGLRSAVGSSVDG